MKEQFYRLSEKQILALAIYGEARGETTEGKIAVCSVILERVRLNKRYGQGFHGVILKPWQFSCFNENDPNFNRLSNIAEQWDEAMTMNASLNDCYVIASGMIDGFVLPNVQATHYKVYTTDVYWSEKMTRVARIGAHEFFI